MNVKELRAFLEGKADDEQVSIVTSYSINTLAKSDETPVGATNQSEEPKV